MQVKAKSHCTQNIFPYSLKRKKKVIVKYRLESTNKKIYKK